ncbi:MAG: hypothetical protein ACRBN8_39335 [Nannocystales bacterium]
MKASIAVVTALLSAGYPLSEARAQPADTGDSSEVPAAADEVGEGDAEGEPSVPAAAPDQDEVRLKNGGMYRGSLAEVVPGDHVTLVPMTGGEPKVIEWDEIATLVRNGEAQDVGAPEAEAAPSDEESVPTFAAAAARKESDGPRLHIDVEGRGDVELHRVVLDVVGTEGSAVASKRVCKAPCDQRIEGTTEGEFFFVGRRVASKRYDLDGRGSSIHATVRPGSRGLRIGGWMMATTGASAMLMGAAFASTPKDLGYRKAAGVALGVGVPMIVAGIIMVVQGRTRVSFGS